MYFTPNARKGTLHKALNKLPIAAPTPTNPPGRSKGTMSLTRLRTIPRTKFWLLPHLFPPLCTPSPRMHPD